MDKMAEAIGIDPLEFRLMNAQTTGEVSGLVTDQAGMGVQYSMHVTGMGVDEPGNDELAAQVDHLRIGRAIESTPGALSFQPFRRGGTARTGSRGAGLGLSIVRAVAAAHGGAVTATPRSGGGLEVTVRLPAGSRTPLRPVPATA